MDVHEKCVFAKNMHAYTWHKKVLIIFQTMCAKSGFRSKNFSFFSFFAGEKIKSFFLFCVIPKSMTRKNWGGWEKYALIRCGKQEGFLQIPQLISFWRGEIFQIRLLTHEAAYTAWNIFIWFIFSFSFGCVCARWHMFHRTFFQYETFL